MADDPAREPDHESAETEGPAPIADEVAAVVVERFPGSVFAESHGQPVVYVDRSVVVDHLLDGTRRRVDGVEPERFEVVMNFLSHARNRRLRIVCQVPESDPTIASLVPVYPGANFPERESYDLFGITFEGHPDMTRILMPDDWHGFPLRKDDAAARVPVTFKGDPSPR